MPPRTAASPAYIASRSALRHTQPCGDLYLRRNRKSSLITTRLGLDTGNFEPTLRRTLSREQARRHCHDEQSEHSTTEQLLHSSAANVPPGWASWGPHSAKSVVELPRGGLPCEMRRRRNLGHGIIGIVASCADLSSSMCKLRHTPPRYGDKACMGAVSAAEGQRSALRTPRIFR